MLITEKQIMQLIQIANNQLKLMAFVSLNLEIDYEEAIQIINTLLGQINSQQSEELKEIK